MFTDSLKQFARIWLVVLSVVLAVGSAGVARAGQPPVPDPVISAQRAIVVDSLTGEVLYAKNPDSRALQGSIAKIMTAHVALWAVKQGYVSLGDTVAISARAQQQGCTCLDLDGNAMNKDVLVGEVFTLRDLLYALFLSAGEATDAIAEYVGGAVGWGIKTTAGSDIAESELRMDYFLRLMNDHVAELGLSSSTRFVTVHGADACDFGIGCFVVVHVECGYLTNDCNVVLVPECAQGDPCGGGTTARDLVKIWNHAVAEHSLFLTAAGARSRTISSTLGSTTKTYTLNHTFNYYPGVDGDKNGASPECIICWLAQATRNGRGLVAVVLQSPSFGQAQTDMNALFRYGFARIFGPDRRPDSGSLSAIKDVALDCFYDATAVTATRETLGTWWPNALALTFWKIDVATGSFAKLATWPTTFASIVSNVDDADVAFVRERVFVTSTVKSSSAQLRSFRLACTWLSTDCSLVPVTTSGSLPGLATGVRLLRLSDTLLVSAVKESSGALRLHSWSVADDGTLSLRSSSVATLPVYEFAIAGESGGGAVLPPAFQVVTAVRDQGDSSLRLYSWSVNAGTGTITKLKDSGTLAGSATNISIARTGTGPYATALTTGTASAGSVKVIFWDVAQDGTFTRRGDTGPGVDYASDTAVARLGPDAVGFSPAPTGVLTALRNASTGDLELVAWELPKLLEGQLADRRIVDSGDLAGYIDRLDLCRFPTTYAAGYYVTAVRTSSGALKLIPWRVGQK